MGLLNPCREDEAFKSLVNSVWREREYFTIMLTLMAETKRGRRRAGVEENTSVLLLILNVKLHVSSFICSIFSCLESQ